MKRIIGSAVLGLVLAVAGCPPAEEESVPVDKMVIVEHMAQNEPPARADPNSKDIDEPSVKSESRPAVDSERPDGTSPNPLGVAPPTVPGVAPIPALPAPTPRPDTEQPPGSGVLPPDK